MIHGSSPAEDFAGPTKTLIEPLIKINLMVGAGLPKLRSPGQLPLLPCHSVGAARDIIVKTFLEIFFVVNVNFAIYG